MPLNGELRAAGGRLIERAATAPHYRLYALSGARPPKPGLLRVRNGAGAAIEVEVWALSDSAFGRFVAAVPPPLSIGTLELGDGRKVKGFLVEAEGVAGARDISSFGGWRAFMAQEARRFDRIAGDEIGQRGSSIKLTWAATTRQPSGKRTQVCIWRPILPGTLAR